MIHVERVRRQFGPQVLFEGLSWLIPRGARLGLVGPNGTGKTSLLRVLAGLDPPDAGIIHRPAAVRIGYLAQEVETVGRGSVLSVVLDGFGEIRDLEEKLEALESKLSGLRPGDPESGRMTQAYGELRHRFEALGGDEIEAKAKTILGGLGVPEPRFHEPLEHLSGGWMMRVALARLLVAAPDLLLLDEPTNHLDLDALEWVERFLEAYDGAFIVVSHDRYFLNRVVRGIVELDRGRLTDFQGNYDEYLQAKAGREAALEAAAKEQAREIARIERFIERFRYKASKARQVQARIRALGKVERIDAPTSARQVRFGFPPAPRSGDVVARAANVWKAYGDNVVFRGFDLVLRRFDRVALVGPNGAGKSTLLKLLSGRLFPDDGTLEIGHNVIVQYFAQHQLEALDPGETVLESMEVVADPSVRPRLRAILGSFLFSGDDVLKKIAVLSGGEKARVALARMLLRPSNLLLLDEPTNHLDLKSREVLEDALDEFEGTLVVISHDRYFINRVATSIVEVLGGRTEMYPGDYDTYLEQAERRAPEAPSAMASEAEERRNRQQDRVAKRIEAEERNRRYRERRAIELEIEPVEQEIARVEDRVRELTAQLSDPGVLKDGAKAREVGRGKAEMESRLEMLYRRWEEIAAKMPN